jgi:hypothetical protein
MLGIYGIFDILDILGIPGLFDKKFDIIFFVLFLQKTRREVNPIPDMNPIPDSQN